MVGSLQEATSVDMVFLVVAASPLAEEKNQQRSKSSDIITKISFQEHPFFFIFQAKSSRSLVPVGLVNIRC